RKARLDVASDPRIQTPALADEQIQPPVLCARGHRAIVTHGRSRGNHSSKSPRHLGARALASSTDRYGVGLSLGGTSPSGGGVSPGMVSLGGISLAGGAVSSGGG